MGAIQRAFVQLLLLKSRKMPSYELWYRFSNLQLLPLLPIGKKKMTALNSKPSNKCLIICLGFNADVSYLSLALILSALLFLSSSQNLLHRFRGRLMTWKWRLLLFAIELVDQYRHFLRRFKETMIKVEGVVRSQRMAKMGITPVNAQTWKCFTNQTNKSDKLIEGNKKRNILIQKCFLNFQEEI